MSLVGIMTTGVILNKQMKILQLQIKNLVRCLYLGKRKVSGVNEMFRLPAAISAIGSVIKT
jgi:hypothetical protein